MFECAGFDISILLPTSSIVEMRVIVAVRAYCTKQKGRQNKKNVDKTRHQARQCERHDEQIYCICLVWQPDEIELVGRYRYLVYNVIKNVTFPAGQSAGNGELFC